MSQSWLENHGLWCRQTFVDTVARVLIFRVHSVELGFWFSSARGAMAGSGRKRPSTGGEKDSSKQSKTKASSDSGISHYPLHEVLTEAQACLATELKDWGWQISSQGSSWLICKKQSQSEAFRKDLQAKDPLDFAGVSAFDKQEYAAAMKKYGCYECCVTYSWFDPLRFAHRAIPPALRFLPVFQLWFRGSGSDYNFLCSLSGCSGERVRIT